MLIQQLYNPRPVLFLLIELFPSLEIALFRILEELALQADKLLHNRFTLLFLPQLFLLTSIISEISASKLNFHSWKTEFEEADQMSDVCMK